MATRALPLPIPGPRLISGGTNNEPMRIGTLRVSTGTPPSGAPRLARLGLLASGTQKEHWAWQFMIPKDYVGSARLRILWSGTAAGGQVRFFGGGNYAAASTLNVGATDLDTLVSGAVANTGGGTQVLGPGYYKSLSMALPFDGAQPNNFAWCWVGRDPSDSLDTTTNDIVIIGAWFEYEDA